ncbi:MAG: hypothetical protein DMF56_25705 [Acidobacteria bacterium]|nr:MAG: hypothetical protein DMF56_25705 [Acidobacteriota bacterium]
MHAGLLFLDRMEIEAELHARNRFFARRLEQRFSHEELRDVTNVVLGTPAAVMRCSRCGILIRDAAPDEDVFRHDQYGADVLERLHETHVRAFRAKAIDYRPLLPSGARVIEVGSYVGGFLSVAEEWGWRAIGTDIGCDVVRFCRRRGLDARCLELRDCALEVDAVFIWNCFEQLASPHEMLTNARRLLHDSGLLVIRVPDAAFYVQRRKDQSAFPLLAYNGLLGWPHRFGYDIAALRGLVEKHRFTFLRALRREAIRPLRDALHSWAREEESAVMGEGNRGWIELTFSGVA